MYCGTHFDTLQLSAQDVFNALFYLFIFSFHGKVARAEDGYEEMNGE